MVGDLTLYEDTFGHFTANKVYTVVGLLTLRVETRHT